MLQYDSGCIRRHGNRNHRLLIFEPQTIAVVVPAAALRCKAAEE